MKKKKILLIVIPVIMICLVTGGITYAFFAASNSVDDKIVGVAAVPDISVEVEEITQKNSILIPIEEDLLGTAISHNPKCIDDNNNEVCDIYKITVTSNSEAALYISGELNLVGNTLPNLKWKEIASDNALKEGVKAHKLGNSRIFHNDILPIGGSKIYYVVVYINEINDTQNDTGTFSGTVTVNAMTAMFPESPKAAGYITNIYTNATKSTVKNNNIDYNYVNIYDTDDDVNTSGGLMNDRKGGITEDLNGGNIRYYGQNPSNYIYFNCSDYEDQSDSTCEKWRIIGVFDGLVKIARNDLLTTSTNTTATMSWDQQKNINSSSTSYSNDWSTSSLREFLNNAYYYGSSYIGEKSIASYPYYSNSNGSATTTLDLTKIGLKNKATRDRIAETTWYLGGHNATSVYSNQVYNYERGDKKCSTCTYDTIWLGNIALMYPSDYGYATDFTKCTVALVSYDDSNCKENDYLYTTSTYTYQWPLTPESSYSNGAWGVAADGDVRPWHSVNNAYSVRPVLYLTSDQQIVGGDGTENTPYQLGA